MKLVCILTAVVAVCSAAKLDRTYLPPASAKTAGGSPGALQTPLSDARGSFPKGSFTNDFQGVVVDAVAAGTRSSDPTDSGLGAPRHTYGSQASKVGNAAFKLANHGTHEDEEESVPGSADAFRTNTRFNAPNAGSLGGHASANSFAGQGFGAHQSNGFQGHERPKAAQDRTANTLRFDSEVGPESFSYAFETDNGISAEESAIATNGVQAQGGFSYTGDDGQTYSVTYTADEGGYQPKGDHLPTPPPIPEEILRSLEQNAREEAAGIIDDGSYDAKKYNEGSDYSESDNGQYKHGSAGNNNQGSLSSGNAFGHQSAGHGSHAFAAANSGRGRVNLGNRNGQDSSSDSSNVNAFTQASSLGGPNNQGQNGFTSHHVTDNNHGTSSFNQQHEVQGNGQLGLETGHGAQSNAFAGQGQNGHKQSFSQASFGQTNTKDDDQSSTTHSGAISNQFMSQLNSQFGQQNRFGNQASINRQGGQSNQYLPPLNKNQGNGGSFQQQSYLQSSSQGQVSHPSNQANRFTNQNVKQFNRGGSQQEGNNNFQSAQSTASSHFGGAVKGSQGNNQGTSTFDGTATGSGLQSGQQSGTSSFGGQLNNIGVSGFKGSLNAGQGINTQSSLNKFGSNAAIGQGSNTNNQDVSNLGVGSAGSGHQSSQQSANSAFGTASFGASSNPQISGAGGAHNAGQSVNTQSTFNKFNSNAGTAPDSHTNDRAPSGFKGSLTGSGNAARQQSTTSAFGSASFGTHSNKPVSSFGGSSSSRLSSNVGAMRQPNTNGQASADFSGALTDIEHQNGQQSASNQLGASFGAQSIGHASNFKGASQAHQGMNGVFFFSNIGSDAGAVHRSNTNGHDSSAFDAALTGHQGGQQSAFGVHSSDQVSDSGSSSNGINGKLSHSHGAEGSNAHGSSAFSSASFGAQSNSGSPQLGTYSKTASGERLTQNRFGSTPQSNFGNSAHASAQFNQGFNVQQKQLSGSQFGTQAGSSQFGHQQQKGPFGSNIQRPDFNQQVSASAQTNTGTGNNNPYHYNQPTKQFGVPTNSQQSTNQFSGLTQTSAAPTPSSQFGFQGHQQQNIANRPSQQTNAAAQNNRPFNGRLQSSAQVSAQFQASQQSQGFQKQTSAIPQPFQPLGQPSSHASSSVQFQSASDSHTNEPTVPSQQYNGEIYEYNKPAQTLPSEKDQAGSPTTSQGTFSSAFTGSNQFSSSSVAGKGEMFGGPRKAPSFDSETGYHY